MTKMHPIQNGRGCYLFNSSNSPTSGGLERLLVGAAEGLEQGVGQAGSADAEVAVVEPFLEIGRAHV